MRRDRVTAHLAASEFERLNEPLQQKGYHITARAAVGGVPSARIAAKSVGRVTCVEVSLLVGPDWARQVYDRGMTLRAGPTLGFACRGMPLLAVRHRGVPFWPPVVDAVYVCNVAFLREATNIPDAMVVDTWPAAYAVSGFGRWHFGGSIEFAASEMERSVLADLGVTR